jgi:M6 family metalloprotease-like protein
MHDGCSKPYPVLPKAVTQTAATAASAGLSQYVKYLREQGETVADSHLLRQEVEAVRDTSGRVVGAGAFGSLHDEAQMLRHGQLAALIKQRQGLTSKDPSAIPKPAGDPKRIPNPFGNPGSIPNPYREATFEATPGKSVGEIDDSSVPDDVKKRIYSPTSEYMKGQAAVYNKLQRLIVIPVDFGAFPRNPSLTPAATRSVFFGTFGTQTVANYFAANSYGGYVLEEGWISDWVRLPATPPPDQLSGSNDLVKAALQGSDVDWSRFANQDGTVTQDLATLVIVAPFGGSGATRYHDVTFPWKGRQIRVKGYMGFFDCKRVNDPTFATDTLSYNMGVILHELNHTFFGLPDRYGTGADHFGHDFVGAYDIMSNSGSPKLLNPHDRMKIGWLEPRVLHLGRFPRTLYKCKAAEAFRESAVVIYSDLSPDEYWIVENRCKDADIWGVDTGLPQSGLCVWWVDAKADVVVLINHHNASDKPLTQPQPELTRDPLFNGADGITEGMLFPQNGTGTLLIQKISAAGPFMSFEI